MTLGVTMNGGLVIGTPLGRSIVTSAFVALLLPPVGTILLRNLRAGALEVFGSLIVVALAAAYRSCHRGYTPRNRGNVEDFLDKSSI